MDEIKNDTSLSEVKPVEKPAQWLNEHKSTKHFLVEFFVILFSNLTRFFKQKDEEIEAGQDIKDSVIKHD